MPVLILTLECYFHDVNVLFVVKEHAKNACDHLLKILKKKQHKSDVCYHKIACRLMHN